MCIFHPHWSIGLWYSQSCVLFSPLLFNIPVLDADFLELSSVCCPAVELGMFNTNHWQTQSWILSKCISGNAPTLRSQPKLRDVLPFHRQNLSFSLGILPASFKRQDLTVQLDTGNEWQLPISVLLKTPLWNCLKGGKKPRITSHPEKWAFHKLGSKVWSLVLK